MEGSSMMDAERKYFNNDKEIDDDVSVIAVVGKENDRSSKQQLHEKRNSKQEYPRVFELSDERSKMALRKQLGPRALSTEQDKTAENYPDMELLQKLPHGTIVIKKEKKYKEDSDYVRDSTETSSGGSTSGGGSTKVRKVHKSTRKNRGTTEVRRNPMRVTKKDADKDFPRLRQRLLSAKRKEMLLNSESYKRGKSSTMPYMNTRSVTRKMYNVGATYQAPTKRDETEFKEWPVHGMHERPVFHPQVGLAAEYLGRYFTTLDGLSYREIIDRPEVEVVSVDPRCDFLPSPTEKKRSKKTRSNRNSASKNSKTSSARSRGQTKSFECCMHESFHCVLGYCSQVMSPAYKTNVEGRINMMNNSKNSTNVSEDSEKQPSVANVVEQSSKCELTLNFKENLQKNVEETKLLDNYALAVFPQGVKNFSRVPKTRLFPTQKVYVANSQKSIAFTNFKTFQGGQMKIQEVVRSAKSPFILVNSSDVRDTQLLKSAPNNLSVIKLGESTSTEETLGELSSIYKNVPNEDFIAKQAQAKLGKKVEFNLKKYLLDNVQQKNIQIPKELNPEEKKNTFETTSKGMNVRTISEGLSKTWCTNEASEIAKILAEYNKSNLKKTAVENHSCCMNVKNVRVKELCSKEENMKHHVQENSAERTVNLTFPQGKWRRFHLTVEKLKSLKSNSNEQGMSSGVQNRQTLNKIDQPVLDTSSERKPEILKQLGSAQRGQSNLMGLEQKENATTVNSTVDTAAVKTQSLQELLENTAMLYCAATGTHQDDLANYIDSLDAAQSIQWLESCSNLIA